MNTNGEPRTETTELSLGYEGWRVAAAGAVGVFVGFASVFIYTFGVLLRPLTEDFGWSRESASAAFGIAAMTVAVCSPFIGHLLDRVSPRRVILPCLLIFGLGYASLSLLTPSLWHFYAIALVLGVVGNGTAHLAYARAVASWFDRRRGMALALVMSGGAAGAMVLPPVMERLIAAYGWRRACLVFGASTLVVGIPVAARYIRARPRAHGDAPVLSGATVREGLRSPVFWTVTVVLFACSIAQNGAIAHLPALMSDRGISGGALAVSALGGGSLAGRFAAGWLLDRFFGGRVAFVMVSMAALGAFILAGADSLILGVVAAALIGVGMGGEADVVPYLLSRYFGLRSFSALYAVTWSVYAVAGAIGPVLMGRMFDSTGSYGRLLAVLAIAMFASGALMLLLPRYGTVMVARPRSADEPSAMAVK